MRGSVGVCWRSKPLACYVWVWVCQVREAAEQKREDAKMACQPDDLIDFVQLKSKKGLSQIEIEDEVNTGW